MSTTQEPRHTLVVGGLVRNDNDEVLLIRHLKRGWEIPQGRVEEGESLPDALHREVREEAGVEITMGPLAAVWSKLTIPSAVIFTFLGTYKSGELNPTGDSGEAAWVMPGKALELVAGSVMKERLRTLLSFDGTITYGAYTLKPYQIVREQIL
jgi:8-oxo-dGTP diphosphatase